MGVAKYSEEFKSKAVSMVVEQGKRPVQVASDLGITTTSLRAWIKQHANTQRGDYLRIQELERENRQLRKELAESQEVVEILKKTAVILGKR
jgi:transposase